MEKVSGVLVMTVLEMQYNILVDNGLSSHTNNFKNGFLILAEREALVRHKKNLILTLVKKRQNLASVCIIVVLKVIYL